MGGGNLQCKFLILSQYPARGMRFPPLHNRGEIYQRLDQYMDVIGHDAPGMEMVALAMEIEERILDILRNIRVRQRTAAHAGVKPRLDALAALNLPLLFR